jgi:hypothetical protein
MGTGPDFQGDFDITRFEPAGPVCKAFIESNGPFDFIRGPWGSGKTVSAVFKIAQKAGTLFPVCKDGKINVRCAAVRETYRELAKTALPTWLRFFPKYGPYTAKEKDAYSGGQDRPVNHILEWDVLRKWPTGWKETTVRLEMQFGAIGTDNLESFFKGYEISYGWLNECDTMHEDVPGLLFGRTGRFPPRDTIMEWEGERLGYEEDPDTGLKVIKIPRMVFGDFNPPDEVNWTYKREIEEPEKWPGYNFFRAAVRPVGQCRESQAQDQGGLRGRGTRLRRPQGGRQHPQRARQICAQESRHDHLRHVRSGRASLAGIARPYSGLADIAGLRRRRPAGAGARAVHA